MSDPDVISCGAVVYRNEDDSPIYLLLRYQATHWDFPKGHMEKGETEKETTRREVQEETGIEDLLFLPGFRRTIRYTYRHRQGPVTKQVVYRIARTQTAREQVRLSHEHIDFAWLPYEKAKRRLTYKNAQGVLDQAHQHLLKQGVP